MKSRCSAALHAVVLLGLACSGLPHGGVQARETAHPTCFNQIQVLATHNSYHIAPDPNVVEKFMANPFVAAAAATQPDLSPRVWEYTHLPLDRQLDLGVRGFELDIHADPEGGRYAQSAALRLAGYDGWLTTPELQQPGFKVLHVPDFDYNSTCLSLKSCLATIKGWSDAHPDHLPILVYLEPKRPLNLTGALGPAGEQLVRTVLGALPAPGPDSLAESLKLNVTLMEALQEEILEVVGRESIITPDDVRGEDLSVSLQELLLVPPSEGTCPWPPLDSMRGKLMFILLLRSSEDLANYEDLHPGQEGALLWLAANSRSLNISKAVFFDGASWNIGLRPNSTLPLNATDIVKGMGLSLLSMVQRGYIVRGRADADLTEARYNFTARRDAIIASGAHAVFTDFVQPSAFFPSSYLVEASPPLAR